MSETRLVAISGEHEGLRDATDAIEHFATRIDYRGEAGDVEEFETAIHNALRLARSIVTAYEEGITEEEALFLANHGAAPQTALGEKLRSAFNQEKPR